ncbi:DUF378 domain-containing protein [Candidatus Gracilibacteria bacterium]|nr:DUF378 domain-containing protein [Candidatus Gracilibacteria bacterium]
MGTNSCSPLGKIAWVLLIIGGLNWGLVGFFQLDLVQVLFGGMPMIGTIVYVLVGLSALYALFARGSSCKK